MDSPRKRREETGGTAIERTAPGSPLLLVHRRRPWQQVLASAGADYADAQTAGGCGPGPADSASARPGIEALAVLADQLDPAVLLDFSEDLHRFAAACGHEAIARLEEQAQKEIPAHLDEVKALSDGMEISVMTGQLRERATVQVVAQQVAVARDCTLQGAARDVERARILRQDVPAVLEALAQGRVGSAHARTMVDLSRKIEPERPEPPHSGDLEVVENFDQQVIEAELECRDRRRDLCDSLLEKAPGRTPSSIRRTGTRLLNRVLDTSASQRYAAERRNRNIRITPGENGMCHLHAYIPSLAGEAIERRLAELATLHTDPAIDRAIADRYPDDEPEAPVDERTRSQVRADAFVELLLAGPRGSGLENIAPEVAITIPATVFPGLAGLAPQPGIQRSAAAQPAPEPVPGERFDDGPQLPVGAVAPEAEVLGAFDPADLGAVLPNSTTWTRLVTDPWTGAMVALDTDQYRPTAAMKRALALRDRTCRVPGCGRRATACEPDHVIEWQDGGTTSLNNLVSVCKRCHRLKSWGLLRLTLTSDGTVQATTWWDQQRAGTPDAPWDTPAEPVGDTGPFASRHAMSPAETVLLRELSRHLEWVNRRAIGYSITNLPPTIKERHKRRVRKIRDLHGNAPDNRETITSARLIAADQRGASTARTMSHLGYTRDEQADLRRGASSASSYPDWLGWTDESTG
ncbi:HNH endonuclease signature motif containing protein [Zhihengliuella halotolerans]|uniref:HNH endonuclease signature motif containing protein n=1 Tax=Zhihengliuella halotolerans TaxID=370736 RepID=UPI000C7F8663|nr:HNH endonuclease signature motif containing protein [Zhihengliuella halotolerans]